MAQRSVRSIGAAIALGMVSLLPACTSSVIGSAASAEDPAAQMAPTATVSPEIPSPSPPPPSTAAVPPTVVVLDPGHNGGNAAAPEVINRPVPAGGFTKPCNTTGTSTDAGYTEHEFTLDVAQRAARLLRAQGVTVLLTRDDDSGVGPCVDDRASFANNAGAGVVLSIHADGAAATSEGFHVIEPALAPDGGNAAVLDASHEAALQLRTAFGAVTGQTPATYPGALEEPGLARRDDLAGLNLARVPALFIECANMRNPEDAAAVSDPGWRQLAAQGIADGLLAYLSSQ